MDPLRPDVAARNFMVVLDAACRRVLEPWFLLRSATADETVSTGIYRERVYCYELYHQLRVLSEGPDGARAGAPDYLLSGEIDKAGLNAVTPGGSHKPDLVWHVPGTFLHNAVVMEVKSAGLRGLAKDLGTLAAFLSVPHRSYSTGLLLVYGPAAPTDLRTRVWRTVRKNPISQPALTNARLVWHPAPGEGLHDLGPISPASTAS